jgi:hypothetical protein
MLFARTATFVSIALFAAAAASGCAASSGEADSASGGDEALSQSECAKVVSDAQSKSKAACAKDASDADQKATARAGLEKAVVSAVSSFGTAISEYQGENVNAISAAVNECSAVTCSGSLQRNDVKAECGVEKALLEGACYVRHLPDILAAASDLDLSKPTAALKSAVAGMDAWGPLALQEATLRAEHAVCATYAGSVVERDKLTAQCRSSCSEGDPTNPFASGWGSACTPPGFEQVKDDTGNSVACGTMQRPISRLGTVCECRQDDPCTQYTAVATSSERGKTCGNGQQIQKLVWDASKRAASLKCM